MCGGQKACVRRWAFIVSGECFSRNADNPSSGSTKAQHRSFCFHYSFSSYHFSYLTPGVQPLSRIFNPGKKSNCQIYPLSFQKTQLFHIRLDDFSQRGAGKVNRGLLIHLPGLVPRITLRLRSSHYFKFPSGIVSAWATSLWSVLFPFRGKKKNPRSKINHRDICL